MKGDPHETHDCKGNLTSPNYWEHLTDIFSRLLAHTEIGVFFIIFVRYRGEQNDSKPWITKRKAFWKCVFHCVDASAFAL